MSAVLALAGHTYGIIEGANLGCSSPTILAAFALALAGPPSPSGSAKPASAPDGTVTLRANGEVIGTGTMNHTVPINFNLYAGMDIGRDNGEVVDLSYLDRAPFPFNSTIDTVTFDVRQPNDPSDRTRLEQEHRAGRQVRHIES